MEYTIWQDMPQVELGPVEYFPRRKLPLRPGEWSRWNSGHRWVLDWCGWRGMRCGVKANGREQIFTRGLNTWHLYGPGAAYCEQYSTEEIRENMWMYFHFKRPFPPLSQREFAVIYDPQERLCDHLRQLHALQNFMHSGSRVKLQGIVLILIGEILTAAATRAGTPEEPWLISSGEKMNAQSLLHQIDSILLENISASPSLEELAGRMNVSVSSLVHRFKSETGMTVIERQRWLKIREARRLLSERGATVKAVAQQLGFSSPFYFSKVFSTVAGLSPQAYVNRGRIGEHP